MRQRTRLTITLPSETITRIDYLIDGVNVRNRSHAVERLINQALDPVVNTAVILAGGKSNRQKAPLKPIGDKYLLSIMLEQLKRHGITQLHICASPDLVTELRARFGNGQVFGVNISFHLEPEPLGTAGALKAIAKHLSAAPFLVLHGDVLTNINLGEFIEFHQREAGMATIAVKPRMSERAFGRVFLQGNQIKQFLSTGDNQGISIVNTGLYVLEPKILNLIKPRKKVYLETEIFPLLAKKGQLNAFIFQGIWYDVSSPASQAEAVSAWDAGVANNREI